MNELKSKILSYKYSRVFFGAICFCGIIGFLITTISTEDMVIKNGTVSIILMAFGLCGVRLCNLKIETLKQMLKNKKTHKSRRAEVIEFKNIA